MSEKMCLRIKHIFELKKSLLFSMFE